MEYSVYHQSSNGFMFDTIFHFDNIWGVQGNHSNGKFIIKGYTETLYRIIIAKTSKQMLNNQ